MVEQKDTSLMRHVGDGPRQTSTTMRGPVSNTNQLSMKLPASSVGPLTLSRSGKQLRSLEQSFRSDNNRAVNNSY